MVILITGASHTGKTLLAQRMIEKCNYPCLSLDLLKMGLIRSGQTSLTPEDDDKLTPYLWSIVSEMIKTALENRQNLIVEGCYIPSDWKNSFTSGQLSKIRYICLVMSDRYIDEHFTDIKRFANVIEQRLDDSCCTIESVKNDNRRYREMCEKCNLEYQLIDDRYQLEL